MNEFDSRLANRLHDLVDDEPDSAPPTQQLLDRGRRARRRRAGTLAGTSFAVAALGAVAIAGTPSTVPGGPVQPGAAATSATVTDPRLQLVAAITNSQNISFRLTKR